MIENPEKLNTTTDHAQEFGWDDEIQAVTSTPVLPDGDYMYTVTDLTRGRHSGSAKIPPCPKATVTLCFPTDTYCAYIKKDLYLSSNMTWLIASFFASIGLALPGESFHPLWDKIIGRRGRARLAVREYEANGETRTANEITRFLPYDSSVLDDDDGELPF